MSLPPFASTAPSTLYVLSLSFSTFSLSDSKSYVFPLKLAFADVIIGAPSDVEFVFPLVPVEMPLPLLL